MTAKVCKSNLSVPESKGLNRVGVTLLVGSKLEKEREVIMGQWLLSKEPRVNYVTTELICCDETTIRVVDYCTSWLGFLPHC